MSRIIGMVVVASALAAAGCARQLTPILTHAEIPAGCALGVPGAKVAAEDTADGIALRFTSMDSPEEMRERARDSAAQHGPGSHKGHSHDGRHGQGADHGFQMSQGPAARTSADDIEGGTRVLFVAVDPTETGALRAKLRKQTDAWNTTKCTAEGLRSHEK